MRTAKPRSRRPAHASLFAARIARLVESNIEVGKQGIMGQISQTPPNSTCRLYGNLGGIRSTVDPAPD